jgi:ring-1,2-phenylacetyl-CoA epoxidase subunit PaaC
MSGNGQLFDYLLRLGDNGLVLAQRLGEWVGKGPVLEEDIASTNVGLDLLGQARLWLAYAGEIEARDGKPGRSEDQLAYQRDSASYRNLLLVEQPNGNYADTIARQFLFDQWHVLLLGQLTLSQDERIAGIAAKAVKEARYHVERSTDWVVRLGDGTELSHARMQAAIDALWMYTGEMFAVDATERALVDAGIAADAAALEPHWRSAVQGTFDEATLAVPTDSWMQGTRERGGKQGVHTEHLSHMLAIMQSLPRAHPNAQW